MADEALSPIEAAESARRLWLTASCQSHLDEVERLYRYALSTKKGGGGRRRRGPPPSRAASTTSDGDDDLDGGAGCNDDEDDEDDDDDDNDDVGMSRKKRRKKSSDVVVVVVGGGGGDGGCRLNREQFHRAGERYALLLCQSGRCARAKRGLASMGYSCRLAQRVLDYPSDDDRDYSGGNDRALPPPATIDGAKSPRLESSPPCRIVDGFLSRMESERLISVFRSPEASYWTDHEYQVEPPSPYFSYVIPLEGTMGKDGTNRFGFIGDLIRKIASCPILNGSFPRLRDDAKFVEIWAHNRPHASGHQMVISSLRMHHRSYINCASLCSRVFTDTNFFFSHRTRKTVALRFGRRGQGRRSTPHHIHDIVRHRGRRRRTDGGSETGRRTIPRDKSKIDRCQGCLAGVVGPPPTATIGRVRWQVFARRGPGEGISWGTTRDVDDGILGGHTNARWSRARVRSAVPYADGREFIVGEPVGVSAGGHQRQFQRRRIGSGDGSDPT
jgi:hypothetical protein